MYILTPHFFAVMTTAFLLSLPCGYWRAGLRKRSVLWFVAIHLPIPFVALLRRYLEIPSVWYVFVILILTCIAAQVVGARIRNWIRPGQQTEEA